MNLKQIKYFCEIVDRGTTIQAAEHLFVAPTAISMQLAQLEEHLGGELFDRSRRPMELTPLGKFFYPRAKDLLFQAKRLDEETHGIAVGKLGWLGIGFTRSTIFSILPSAVRKFRESFPDVKLELVELLSDYQPEQLREGRIHIGLSRFIGRFDQPADLNHTVMFKDPFVAALPLNHKLAENSSICVSDLDGVPFILYPKDSLSIFSKQMLSILKEAGVSPVVTYEASEIHTALALVAANLGITLVGQSVSYNNRSDVVFIPVRDIGVGMTMVAITRAEEDSKIVASFLDLLNA